MSWLTKLCEAYDCGANGQSELVPVGFVKKEVKYNVILNADGSFFDAEEFPEKNYEIVPTSPKAEARTTKDSAYPLAEQLKYFVCDDERPNAGYENYMKALSEWCEEPDAPVCLRVLYGYLEKETLLEDLTQKAGLSIKFYDNKGLPKGADANAIVAFSVHSEDGGEDRLWKREEVIKSWEKRAGKISSEKRALCYVNGQVLPIMESHPKVQKNAKLVSGKDAEFPFVYKGRFVEDNGSAAVDHITSAKAYNALKWLVERQGFRRYGLTFVAWNTSGAVPPNAISDSLFHDEEGEDESPRPDTFEASGIAVKEAAMGKRNEMAGYDPKRVCETVLLGMESATPGRMSINYYREIPNRAGGTDDYISCLEHWYTSCVWEKYDYKSGRYAAFTPTPHEIAKAVLGIQTVKTADADLNYEKSDSKQLHKLLLRLIDPITAKKNLPHDIVLSAFERAVQPQSFKNPKENKWAEYAWRDAVSTTCALIHKENPQMTGADVDEHFQDRSYLFGRLLAIADFLEYDAGGRKKETVTNALSLMSSFVQRPCEMWMRLHDKLIPYIAKLPVGDVLYYKKLLGSVESLFSPGDRMNNERLGELFLPGYYSQRKALYHKKPIDDSMSFARLGSRSELYGCLAAVADKAEHRAASQSDFEDRGDGVTNVLRYMTVLEQRPISSWAYVHEKVIPYLEKLGKASSFYSRLFAKYEKMFSASERADAEPLDSGFLHGYYCTYLNLSIKTDKNKSLAEPVTELLQEEKGCTEECKPYDREEIFGTLLGIENHTERLAMDIFRNFDAGDYRISNALRYISAFSKKPMTTWKNLRIKMDPYLRHFADGGDSVLGKVEAFEKMLSENGWDNDEPLTGVYLNNYYRV